MSWILTEYVIETVVRQGLAYLKNNPSVLNDIFSQMNDPLLATDYGQQSIDMIYKYIFEDRIYVIQGFILDTARMPSFIISIDPSNESEREAAHQDYGGYTLTPKQAQTIIGAFAPISYTPTTGAVLVQDTVPVNNIVPNSIFVDVNQNQFPIIGGVVARTGATQFNIGQNASPAPVIVGGFCSITGNVSQTKTQLTMIPQRENIIVGTLAQNNTNLTKWCHIILMWILHYFKETMEENHVQLSNINSSDLHKLNELMPDNVYARWATLSCLTQSMFNQSVVQIVGNAAVGVEVQKDIYAIIDPNLTVNTTP